MAHSEASGRLVPVGGGDPIPLTRDVLTVGRRPSCNICLKFPDVSGLHCEFIYQDGVWAVRDLGSSNGVKVKGERVSGRKRLRPGDELAIGNRKFTIEYSLPHSVSFDDLDDDDIFEQGLLEKAGLEKPKPTRPGDY